MTPAPPRRSYDPRSQPGGLEAEIRRLAAQVAASWPVEAALLTRLGLANGMRVLELGCGPGLVTSNLRDMLPDSPLVALDHDPELLDRARGLHLKNVEFVEGDAADTGLPHDSFDVVLSRYLFQHLGDPVSVAREAVRLLKPGGLQVIVDVDDELWGVAEPSFPHLRRIYSQAIAAQAERGGNRLIGRRLGRILRDAGCRDVSLEVFSYNSDERGIQCFLPQIHPDRLLAQVDPDRMKLEDLASLYAGFEAFENADSAFVLFIGFAAHGKKAL